MPLEINKTEVWIRFDGAQVPRDRATLPRALRPASRAAGAPPDPIDKVLKLEAEYDLSRRTRAAGGGEVKVESASVDRRLIALEAEDGSTVFIRIDKLREDLDRLYPDAISEEKSEDRSKLTLDLSVLRDTEGASRGFGDWIWSKLKVLRLEPDEIIDAATKEAAEYVTGALQDLAADKVEELTGFSVSTFGAKALMWAIESKLAGKPGLYRWQGGKLETEDRFVAGDPRLLEAVGKGQLLIFIHGTASSTAGSFKDLAASERGAWSALEGSFKGGVYGFEHRTFSESPIDNALALAELLPPHAELCLVTHSRGGLVGDLLCLGSLSDDLIKLYGDIRRGGRASRIGNEDLAELETIYAAEELEKLRKLGRVLAEKDFRIQRYVRVACPAGGTSLLSDNLEVFLSGLLSLMNAAIGAITGGAAATALSAFKRVVLEIAEKRLEAHHVPGIEAMLDEAPLGVLLARAPRKQGVKMAVIAGDIEGGHILKRIAVMFTDWMFFDAVDNDLVVDTESMFQGVARMEGASYLFMQSENVNHFRYFRNAETRSALTQWLTKEPAELPSFRPLLPNVEPIVTIGRQRALARSATRSRLRPDSRPVVIFLPGIMGSHLEKSRKQKDKPGSGDRVWFDFTDILTGGIGQIRISSKGIDPEALFEMFYGDLAEHLGRTHWIIPWAYDWRLPIQDTANELAATVRQALKDHPNQPVRLLAHSMGGLVARAMIAQHEEIWKDVVARPGGRLVMLGTPNNGSHLMVETLLGKSGTIRKLARVDLAHRMDVLLEIVAAYPGAVQLLPRPGFNDTGETRADYLTTALWDEEFRNVNRDRWFGDGVVGVPTDDAFEKARKLWTEVLIDDDGRHRPILPFERVSYIFGKDKKTACGVEIKKGRLRMQGTTEGDGSVSWSSGRLDFLPDDRYWHMPVDHAALTDTKQYFPAIDDLLQTGGTTKLGRLPRARGALAMRAYDAGPEPYPSVEELVRGLLGGRPKPREVSAGAQRLDVSVMGMDLRHSQLPVLCGHYIGDPIAGAEHQIDSHLVDGALRERDRLGLYPGEIGSSAIVLMPRSQYEVTRGTGKGALIVGLGNLTDTLTARELRRTVRVGVLNLLLWMKQRHGDLLEQMAENGGCQVRLASLLVGHNSTTNISIADSVDAITLGVCQANNEFRAASTLPLRISELRFLELYLDTAITAARAVRGVTNRLESELRSLGVHIAPAEQLHRHPNLRRRLRVEGGGGYWPRVIVTDADRPAIRCERECYESRWVSSVPEDVERKIVARYTAAEPRAAEEGKELPSTEPAPEPAASTIAKRLRFLYLSQRARAESVLLQRQPGVVERLVERTIDNPAYDADLARTLFFLMVPREFKSLARDAERLVLVVDDYTANLPWEMMQAGEEPAVLQTSIVRQLVAIDPPKVEQSRLAPKALVIANPSTVGFKRYFDAERPLDPLPGAEEEGLAVREVLESQDYDVTQVIGSDKRFEDVFASLAKDSYRIIVIAAHGIHRERLRNGEERTGVVLSDGMLLTAAEVKGMEVVPEVVFLNCCHLGKTNAAVGAVNRLAYSVSSELIAKGVRCVLAAGWAVNDAAAHMFAKTFFTEFVAHRAPFGEAVQTARVETYRNFSDLNTWGAYQAYGDPAFRLETAEPTASDRSERYVAVDELIEALHQLRGEASHDKDLEKARERVDETLNAAPAEWAVMPQVHAAIAAVYAEYGLAGFPLARAAYLRAIGHRDIEGEVRIRTIEQLANLEARTAEDMGTDPSRLEEAVKLVDGAIERLDHHIAATEREVATGIAAEDARDLVRASGAHLMKGNALKIKTLLECKVAAKDKELGTVVWTDKAAEILQDAQREYGLIEGSPDDPGFEIYATLNRLQLDAVLGDAEPETALAARCEVAAQDRFERTFDFWDAVGVADARLTALLLLERFEKGEVRGRTSAERRARESEAEQRVKDAVAEAYGLYKDVADRVPRSELRLNSTIRQLKLLASLFEARGKICTAEALRELVEKLPSGGSAGQASADDSGSESRGRHGPGSNSGESRGRGGAAPANAATAPSAKKAEAAHGGAIKKKVSKKSAAKKKLTRKTTPKGRKR